MEGIDVTIQLSECNFTSNLNMNREKKDVGLCLQKNCIYSS